MLGTIVIQENAVPPPVVAAALEKQKKFQDHQAQELKVVKVSAEKLDKLVDLVGELVIAGGRPPSALASRAADRRPAGGHPRPSNKLVEEIRDNALACAWCRSGRPSAGSGGSSGTCPWSWARPSSWRSMGAETELDKTIVEKLGDPLMHIVRNSIDHGIEPAELRLARGKPEAGSLSLQRLPRIRQHRHRGERRRRRAGQGADPGQGAWSAAWSRRTPSSPTTRSST